MKLSTKYKRQALAKSLHFAAFMLSTAAHDLSNRYHLDKTGNKYLSIKEREYAMKMVSKIYKDSKLLHDFANLLARTSE